MSIGFGELMFCKVERMCRVVSLYANVLLLRVQRIEWLPGAFILLLKDTKRSSKVLDVMTKVLLVV